MVILTKQFFCPKNGEYLKGEWVLASNNLNEAVRMARAIGYFDSASETWLVLTKLNLDQLSNPLNEAHYLALAHTPAYYPLAELWLTIGNHDQAKKYALEAYKKAWANGEPYVHRYELDKAKAILNKLGVNIPELPIYNPNKDEKLPWEDKVKALIERLKSEKAKKNL